MKLKDLEKTVMAVQDALLRDTRVEIKRALESVEAGDFEDAEQRLSAALLNLGERRGVGNLYSDVLEGSS